MYKIEITLSDVTPCTTKYLDSDTGGGELLTRDYGGVSRAFDQCREVFNFFCDICPEFELFRYDHRVSTIAINSAVVDYEGVQHYVGSYIVTITFSSKRKAKLFNLNHIGYLSDLKKIMEVREYSEGEVEADHV